MKILFKYDQKENLNINTVSVIGDFNEYNPDKGVMEKEEGSWIFYCDIKEGEYKYKFLINGELKLNDPTANIYLPDDNEELWSAIIINENDQRLYNNTQYNVNIDKYNITCNINEEKEVVNKKAFNILSDKKVVVRFDFTQVTGLHCVTVAWFNPLGELFQFAENSLFTPKNNNDPIKLWFWMDLNDSNMKQLCGSWTLKMFVDGEFILEDEFKLNQLNAYSSLGKMM
ncbi:hypothetical protein [Clostridium weizhouense]|uniref:AMP-activated protein kinase glycogen-binding domain-containing protein n=1 Tax=Clostridium weizhouense TaxID=2859781 RepID=A0ABS7ANR2_9CLOT|nr:hypothetical protein [Clostridium weizhouense]MBW6410051.1 hypothetical protein [Clostridium weizhouense]